MAKISYCCPFSEANLRIFLQVSSFFSSYKDCNGSCIRKSVFCPSKDVCESPNLLCSGECLPARHSQWYQVWYVICLQKEPYVVCYNQCLPDFYRQRYQVWISRLSTEVAYFCVLQPVSTSYRQWCLVWIFLHTVCICCLPKDPNVYCYIQCLPTTGFSD
jgi:hypothetical protein